MCAVFITAKSSYTITNNIKNHYNQVFMTRFNSDHFLENGAGASCAPNKMYGICVRNLKVTATSKKSSKFKSPTKWNTPNKFFKTHQQSYYICLTTLHSLSANQFKTVPNYPQTSNLV